MCGWVTRGFQSPVYHEAKINQSNLAYLLELGRGTLKSQNIF